MNLSVTLAAMGWGGWAAIAAVAFVALFVIGAYNALVRLRMRVRNGWSQIDVQLKRRYDLIPNLVEVVKGYAAYERETLERVIQARNAAMTATGPAQHAAAENVLTGALKSLFALAEAYPNLKANENFMRLQEELTGTENKISFSRQYYNDVVERYNAKIQSFPVNMIAGLFGFREEQFFKAAGEAEREAPKVKF